MWLGVCYAGCAVRALRNKVMKIYRESEAVWASGICFVHSSFGGGSSWFHELELRNAFASIVLFKQMHVWNGMFGHDCEMVYQQSQPKMTIYCSKMLARCCSKQLIWWDMWEIRTNRAKFVSFEMRSFLESAAIDWSGSKECKLGAKLPKQMGQTEQKQTSITV